MIELKILEPQADLPLFQEAYQWRSRKKHVGAEEAPFEAIIADDPHQIVIGVFNGQFCAMYLLYEDAPRYFSCHFTSKRGTSRDTLVEAGMLIRDTFLHNGAEELCAWVTHRNRALMAYLDELGFKVTEQREFACQNDTTCHRLPADTSEPPMRMFTKYAVRGEPPSG